MGIKQRFFSKVTESAKVEGMEDVFARVAIFLASGAQQPIIVIDGANFLMGFAKGKPWYMSWPGFPRLKEMRELLRTVLSAIIDACGDVQLHFVFDGLGDVEASRAKEDEHNRRQIALLLEFAEAATAFQSTGYCLNGGGIVSSTVLKQILLQVLPQLPGKHKAVRAHALGCDSDVATVLYARSCNACCLMSTDSDFLITFDGLVIPVNSISFRLDGTIQCKGIQMTDRLEAFQLCEVGHLKVLAFIAGTDFTRSILEVENGNWEPLVTRTRSAVSSASRWQDAVQSLAADENAAELFLRHYDLDAFSPSQTRELDDFLSPFSWDYKGSLACGVTTIFPLHSGLDPVLLSLGSALPKWLGKKAGDPRNSDRLLACYSQGLLTGKIIDLLRFGKVYIGTSPADYGVCESSLRRGLGFHFIREIKAKALARIRTFFAGQATIVDSWDDDEATAEISTIPFEYIKDHVLNKCLEFAQLIVPREQESRNALKPQYEMFKELAKKEREYFIESLHQCGGVTEMNVLKEIPLEEWLWSGAIVAQSSEDEAICKNRARSFFYLATGKDLQLGLPVEQVAIVEKCIGSPSKCILKDFGCLFVILLHHLIGQEVSVKHMKQLCTEIADGFKLGLPQEDMTDSRELSTSALRLGDLCWWLFEHIQNVYCLVGGEGLLFPQVLPLDGGPVVLTDGHVHKAKEGYKITIKSFNEQNEVNEDVKTAAKNLLTTAGARCLKDFQYGFKVNSVAPDLVFRFHSRLLFHGRRPYKLSVKAFDK